MHHNLLRLFSGPDSLSTVTTNFDTLFEEAAKEILPASPGVFVAPALPLGRLFNGIVHVHGSIDRPNDMVVTDADFGRAYLTEGWARRFLVDLFRSYTVLFVGYGHRDTVMNYLARALPVGETQPRFALADEGDGSLWQMLGIEPVYYAKPSSDDYSALYQGVESLANHARRGILDWQRDITGIAQVGPSLDEEAMALIRDGLSDPVHTRFFTEAASDVEWVRWLNENEYLNNLFGIDTSAGLGHCHRLLAQWLAQKFAHEQPDELFMLITNHGMALHSEFWHILGWTVGLQKDQPFRPDLLARWGSLLVATAPSNPDGHILLWLGERCAEAGLTEILVDIFRLMSATRLLPSRRPALFPDVDRPSLGADVVQKHRYHDLKQLWDTGLKLNLDSVAEPLLTQIVQDFTVRHRSLRTWQSASREWDRTAYARSAIEAHGQDKHPQAVDAVIDAARDCLAFLASKQPEVAVFWCARLVRSDVPILRRLAVHVLGIREDLSPNEKIDWILTKIGLHDLSAHHELFRVMRTLYPDATSEQGHSIIEEVYKCALPGPERPEDEQTTAYRHFTWLHWLWESDPDCGIVKPHLDNIRERYPKFEPREWADLTHYNSTGFVGHTSPWTTEELLSQPASEWVERLLSFQVTEFDGPDREGLGLAVQDAANRDFAWGIASADSLAKSDSWGSDLWRPLLGSWPQQTDEENLRDILKRLGRPELYLANGRLVADTLRASIDNGPIPEAPGLLSEANRLASAIWDSLDETEPVMQMEDWYGRAINHSAGGMAQFCLLSLSLWYRQQDPRPENMNDEYSAFLGKMVEAQTTAGRLARSAIARHLPFVMSVDEDWAIERVVPLFRLGDKIDRRAVWDGFLYGRIDFRVAGILQDTFLEAAESLDELFADESEPRRLFIKAFAAMLAYFVDEPLTSWIPAFFSKAAADDGQQLAWDLGDVIGDMEDAQQQELCQRWLNQYWENRLGGIPAQLTPEEAGGYARMAPTFP